MTTQTAAGSTSVAQLGDTTVATQTVAGSESGGQSSTMLQLPLRELGLKYVPAIPVDVRGMADTVSRLAIRINQREQALQGLSKMFTIGGSTARAYNFLYGSGAADKKAAAAREASHAFLARDPSEIVSGLVGQLKQPHDELALIAVGGGDDLTQLALDDPKQWSIGWTTFPDVYSSGLPHLEEWAASVDVAQPDKATAAFFPTIARNATTFNQILLRKIPSSDVGDVAGPLRSCLDRGAGCSGKSRLAVRDRSTDLRDAAAANGRRHSSVHAEHRDGAGAGPGDQNVDSRARSSRRRQ